MVFGGSIGSDYFDLFRQRSDKFDISVFMRKSTASMFFRRGSDSLCVSLSAAKDYIGFANKASHLSGTVEREFNGIDVTWRRTESFFRVGASVSLLSHRRSLEPGVSVFASLFPFGPVLECSGMWERSPQVFRTAILYEGDAMPIEEILRATTEVFCLTSRPFADLQGSIRFRNTEEGHDAAPNNYSFTSRNTSIGISAAIEYLPSERSSLLMEHGIDERRITAVLNSDAQSFGDLSNGIIITQYWRTRYISRIWSIPASFSYTYERTTASTSGHLESWPLGGFVSSVVSNRINFQFDGAYDLHTLDVVPEFVWSSASLRIRGSIIHANTGAAITHWQPLFLVFGTKDFGVDQPGLEWLRLVKLGFNLSVPVFSFIVDVQFEQYIPFQLHYAEEIPKEPVGPDVTSAKPKSSADGGRRFSVTFRFR